MRHAKKRPPILTRRRLIVLAIAIVAVLGAGTATAVIRSDGNAKPPVAAGDSQAHCITLGFRSGVINQSMIAAANNLTGMTYNCLSTFANPMPAWSAWEQPWMFATVSDGWDAWLAASPAHQAIVGIDLIPQSVSNNKNPLTWEQACAAGSYNAHATKLAENLVSYGAGKVVIRLGIEANGTWEADYVGTTSAEMSAWAKCYDNEVAAMRAVPGANFLFVWNPNICTANIPISKWYPGNSYVDIIGADAYDLDCNTQKTVSQEGWAQYSTNSLVNTKKDPDFPSLDNIAAFAKAQDKPLSFPEWGLGDGKPDDVAYVDHLAQISKGSEFSFESYFDDATHSIVQLGPAIPKATAAYAQAFKSEAG
jgi:hypothetical protein